MKKYLFGIFAIVLAIGLSAFTVKSDSQRSNTIGIFWYDEWNHDLDIENNLFCEILRLELSYPGSTFNYHGDTGYPFEYGRQFDNPEGVLIYVIYKEDWW